LDGKRRGRGQDLVFISRWARRIGMMSWEKPLDASRNGEVMRSSVGDGELSPLRQEAGEAGSSGEGMGEVREGSRGSREWA
jgi:hypothetical protein